MQLQSISCMHGKEVITQRIKSVALPFKFLKLTKHTTLLFEKIILRHISYKTLRNAPLEPWSNDLQPKSLLSMRDRVRLNAKSLNFCDLLENFKIIDNYLITRRVYTGQFTTSQATTTDKYLICCFLQ